MAAMKQCRRSYLPEIAAPLDFELFLKEQNEDDVKLVFHPDSGGQALERINLQGDIARVTVLVGPEAGLTADEMALAEEAGFLPVSLGPRILRTETAGPVATALVLQLLGEFS
jgi:16S rRNA (uracil1498-N3)-methyltransferase